MHAGLTLNIMFCLSYLSFILNLTNCESTAATDVQFNVLDVLYFHNESLNLPWLELSPGSAYEWRESITSSIIQKQSTIHCGMNIFSSFDTIHITCT